MLPEMGRQLDENVLAQRSHFKTDLFGGLVPARNRQSEIMK